MKYTGFHIVNYKAIDEIDVPVSRNTIPLIGINESGKTSILQAILAFDSGKDHLLEGAHIAVKNIYKPRAKGKLCKLSARVNVTSDEEKQQIIKQANLKTGDGLFEWFDNTFNPGTDITIQRVTDENNNLTSDYLIIGAPEEYMGTPAYGRLIKSIVKRLPNILYFDDFSDRVPQEIPFTTSYIETGKRTRTNSATREWQDIVEEVLRRAGGDELTLSAFCGIDNSDEREDALSDIAEVLNKEIIDEWDKLKKAHARFDASEPDNLELSLSCNSSDKDKYVFAFKVKDTESDNHKRTFDITARSKGFQWYFNFIMKLKFNPKYDENPCDAIYLLDEPGSYLHSSAQTELLRKLVEISSDNTILFCTHSQYLLDPDVINLSDVRIVEKRDGIISISNYGESAVEKTNGAYTALEDALHLKIGATFNFLNSAILLEGITDWCFFKMFVDTCDCELIPGYGCTQLKSLISLLIASSEKFLVVLDNDDEGRKAYQQYKSDFQDLFISNVYQYPFSNKKNFELENVLSSDDIKRIKEATGCAAIKKAIIKLFYQGEEDQEQIRKQFSDETLSNIHEINMAISSHFLSK